MVKTQLRGVRIEGDTPLNASPGQPQICLDFLLGKEYRLSKKVIFPKLSLLTQIASSGAEKIFNREAKKRLQLWKPVYMLLIKWVIIN